MEMLRYRDNKIAANFGYCALIADAAAFCIFYSSTKISIQDKINILGITSSGFWCGFDVVFNIVSLLFLFLSISRMKAYSKGWGIFAMAFGAFQLFRPFIYPLALFNAIKVTVVDNVSVTARILETTPFVWVTSLFILSGLLLIVAGALSLTRGKILRDYLKTVKPIEDEKAGVK
jgi:uncharacterized membrane protein